MRTALPNSGGQVPGTSMELQICRDIHSAQHILIQKQACKEALQGLRLLLVGKMQQLHNGANASILREHDVARKENFWLNGWRRASAES